MTARPVPPVIPAASPDRRPGKPGPDRLMPLASPPGRLDVVYGFGRIDAAGRVADRVTIAARGWRGGDRLTVTAEAGVMIARRDPGGMVTVPARPEQGEQQEQDARDENRAAGQHDTEKGEHRAGRQEHGPPADGRRHTVYLDELTHALAIEWTRERHRLWPLAANPYLLVSQVTAADQTRPPVAHRRDRCHLRAARTQPGPAAPRPDPR
jgi:hypothetical protein